GPANRVERPRELALSERKLDRPPYVADQVSDMEFAAKGQRATSTKARGDAAGDRARELGEDMCRDSERKRIRQWLGPQAPVPVGHFLGAHQRRVAPVADVPRTVV